MTVKVDKATCAATTTPLSSCSKKSENIIQRHFKKITAMLCALLTITCCFAMGFTANAAEATYRPNTNVTKWEGISIFSSSQMISTLESMYVPMRDHQDHARPRRIFSLFGINQNPLEQHALQLSKLRGLLPLRVIISGTGCDYASFQ